MRAASGMRGRRPRSASRLPLIRAAWYSRSAGVFNPDGEIATTERARAAGGQLQRDRGPRSSCPARAPVPTPDSSRSASDHVGDRGDGRTAGERRPSVRGRAGRVRGPGTGHRAVGATRRSRRVCCRCRAAGAGVRPIRRGPRTVEESSLGRYPTVGSQRIPTEGDSHTVASCGNRTVAEPAASGSVRLGTGTRGRPQRPEELPVVVDKKNSGHRSSPAGCGAAGRLTTTELKLLPRVSSGEGGPGDALLRRSGHGTAHSRVVPTGGLTACDLPCSVRVRAGQDARSGSWMRHLRPSIGVVAPVGRRTWWGTPHAAVRRGRRIPGRGRRRGCAPRPRARPAGPPADRGWVMGVFAAGAIALIVTAVHLGRAGLLRSLVSPDVLLAVSVVCVLVMVGWMAVIMWTYVATEPGRRSAPHQVLGVVVSVALCAAVAVPLGTAADLANTQRTLLDRVFAGDAPGDRPRSSRRSGAAAAAQHPAPGHRRRTGPHRRPDRHDHHGQRRDAHGRHHAVRAAPQHRARAVPAGLAGRRAVPRRLPRPARAGLRRLPAQQRRRVRPLPSRAHSRRTDDRPRRQPAHVVGLDDAGVADRPLRRRRHGRAGRAHRRARRRDGGRRAGAAGDRRGHLQRPPRHPGRLRAGGGPAPRRRAGAVVRPFPARLG